MENEFYKPRILENCKISGLSAETIPQGQTGKILVKLFMSSLDPKFSRYYNNIISAFYPQNPGDSLNNLLVIIKPDDKAYIYTIFPFSVKIKASRDLKKGELVLLGDLADLEDVSFHDSSIDLNPESGDQIIWLFRKNWHFGLFFDFTRQQGRSEILSELGYHYKRMMYLETFTFLSTEKHFKSLINDGWFPFIRLLNGQFENLITYYEEDKKFKIHVEKIIEYFTDDQIRKFVERWWSNPILNKKKKYYYPGLRLT